MKYAIIMRHSLNVLLAAVLLVGCTAANSSSKPPRAEPSVSVQQRGAPSSLGVATDQPLPALTQMPEVDCGWVRTAYAWDDANQNGIRDANELPLSGVQFQIFGYGDRVRNSRPTDQTGSALLEILLPGCPNLTLEVNVMPPTGYRATTPTRVRSDLGNAQEVFGFGFTKQP